jgi:hypothetical protein
MSRHSVWALFALSAGLSLTPAFALSGNASAPQQKFKLRAEIDTVASMCAGAGISIANSKLPAIALKVDYGSPGYWAGIQKDDRILSVDVSKNEILIERDGKQYCARLDTAAANVPLRANQSNSAIPGNQFPSSIPASQIASAIPATGPVKIPSNLADGNHPFSPQAIAEVGPNAVHQHGAPNCWFEASVSALAATQKGQVLLSQMITKNSNESFTVHFPNDPQSFTVTDQAIAQYRIQDVTDWARIIQCAERQKFPNTDASEGVRIGIPLIYRGLSVLTGTEAHFKRPDEMSAGEISTLLSHSLAASRPVVLASKSPQENGHLRQIVMPNHAYAVLAFDPSTETLTLKNPYGAIERINLNQVPQYFRYISWVDW